MEKNKDMFDCDKLKSNLTFSLCIGRQLAKNLGAIRYPICIDCDKGNEIRAGHPEIVELET